MTDNLAQPNNCALSPSISSGSNGSGKESTCSPYTAPASAPQSVYTERLAMFTVRVNPLAVLKFGTTTIISRDPRTNLGEPAEKWHDLELMALILGYEVAVNAVRNGSPLGFFVIVEDVWRKIMLRLELPIKLSIGPMYLEHVWLNIIASFRTIAYHMGKSGSPSWYDYSIDHHARILRGLPSITPQIYYELDSRFSPSFTQFLHSLNDSPPPVLPLVLEGRYITRSGCRSHAGQNSEPNQSLGPSSSDKRKRSLSPVNLSRGQSPSDPSRPIQANKSPTDSLLSSFRTSFTRIVARRIEDMNCIDQALAMSLLTEAAKSKLGSEIASALEDYMEFEEMNMFRRQVACEELILCGQKSQSVASNK
ncbi:hypothetical protein V1517DRAFT_376722 [Lipomyces orientalis]|uniref:Uncharacterized protein n=1 Tax=Lipomyces orientalis TaxID=1233043 RepID=A0ACC3TE71_9ASCO